MPNFAVYLLFLLSKCINCHTTDIPIKSIIDFTELFASKNVILHVDTNQNIRNLSKAAQELINSEKYFMVANFMKNSCDLKSVNIDLHFLIFDNFSLNYTLDCFNIRRKFNKEPWVVLVRDSNNINDVKEILKSASLDLDDDVLILINDNSNEMKIYEIYKINQTSPIISNYVGVVNKKEGLNFTSEPKWYRRKDLMVKFTRFLSVTF